MKRTAIVFQHVAFEDLGSFEGVLRDHHYEIRMLQAGVDDLSRIAQEEAHLTIALGGPVSVNDEGTFRFLRREREILRARLALDLPCLGICLGAQLMAAALGARVSAMSQKEIGWSVLQLLRASVEHPLRALEGTPVLHWHGEQFELPEGVRALASTPSCANQAFAWRHNGLALQFHPEVTARNLERWYIGHVVELAAAGIDIKKMREESLERAPVLRQRAQSFFDKWLTELST